MSQRPWNLAYSTITLTDDVARLIQEDFASCLSLCFCLKVCSWCSQIQMYGSTLFHDPCLYTPKHRALSRQRQCKSDVRKCVDRRLLIHLSLFTMVSQYLMGTVLFFKFHRRIQKSVSVTAQINSLSHYFNFNFNYNVIIYIYNYI